MIHVCRVDIGCRYIFDMSDGIDDVYKLKLAIEKDYSIPLNDQIMLISGGCLLNNIKQKLYGLCAGIEESPIYLIDRKLASSPPQLTQQQSFASAEFNYLINQSTIDDINKRILESIKLQASYQTVQLRTQLAQQCYEYSQQMHKLCESTYLDQYWQYQGFMALIANLDDNLIAFEKTYNNCKQQFQRYNENKDSYKSKINEIENYLQLLSKIRLLPEIVQDDVTSATSNNRYLFNSSIYSTAGGAGAGSQLQLNAAGGGGGGGGGGVVTSPSASSIVSSPPNSSYLLATSPSSPPPPASQTQSPPQSQSQLTTATLLEWTNSLDPRHKLDIIIERARDILANIDTNWWLNLDKRIDIIMKDADNRQMKEIEGLTKRLADLNNFLDICKTCVSRQKEIAESFKANQMRATTLRDDTILIDLCMGHERQLELLKENHQQMVDITKKIIKAKLELIRVINSRLNWVMNIQTTIGGEINKNLYMQTQTIKQLDRIMKQVEQLKNAPNAYLISLNETIRREKFSSVYKRFLSDMYSLMNEINKFESEKRDYFKQKVQFSYVSSLFPYLNEQLVSKQADFLSKFDQNLPKLSENDVKLIENDVNEYLKENNLTGFDDNEQIKTISNDDSDEKNRFNMKLIEKLSEKIENEMNKWKIDRENRAKEACKADTSTTMVAQASDSTLFLSTLTDDTQLVNDEEQMVLINKKPLANEQFLKDLNQKIQQELAELRSINNKNRQIDDCLKQFLLELEQFKRQLCVQVEKINEKKSHFYSHLIENLFNNENQQQQQQQQDQSPSSSDTSSATATTTDLFADGIDESFYNKLKDNLLKLRELYEIKLDNLRKQHEQTKTNYMADRQKQFNDALNKLISDKDKQINELKDELNKMKFNLNNTQLREQLLLDKVSSMEKQLLPSQSSILSTSPTTTTTTAATSNSVSVITSSASAGNINVNNNNNSGSSSTLKSTSTNRSIELCTCTVNDLVIVVYDARYESYKIINQTSPYIHFVHTDSLKLFELINNPSVINSISNTTTTTTTIASSPTTILSNESMIQETSLIHNSESTCEVTQLNEDQQQPPPSTNQQYQPTNRDYLYSFIGHAAPIFCSSSNNNDNSCNNDKYVKPLWFVGTVLSKEFCVAKKEANRYHVPSGTRFYRVKVKPYKL